MKTYQYKLIVHPSPPEWMQRLNELGRAGWRAISVFEIEQHMKVRVLSILLMREVPEGVVMREPEDEPRGAIND